jgi:hypothetical protein
MSTYRVHTIGERYDVVWTIEGATTDGEAGRTARALAADEAPGIPDVENVWEVGGQ